MTPDTDNSIEYEKNRKLEQVQYEKLQEVPEQISVPNKERERNNTK
jgi:hypothetical protein